MGRGFGFVEFKEHVHALECLRFLNNNPAFAWAAFRAKTLVELYERCGEKIEDDPASPRYILTRRGVGYYYSTL